MLPIIDTIEVFNEENLFTILKIVIGIARLL